MDDLSHVNTGVLVFVHVIPREFLMDTRFSCKNPDPDLENVCYDAASWLHAKHKSRPGLQNLVST